MLPGGWTEGGATGLCRHDQDLGNALPDCPDAEWAPWATGGLPPLVERPWATTETASSVVASGQTGVVRFDVTADVEAFLAATVANEGWVIKTAEDLFTGEATFASRETATPPRLVLVVGGIPSGGVGGSSGGDGGAPPADAVGSLASTALGVLTGGPTAASGGGAAYVDCGSATIDDGNECTDDACNSVDGVTHTPRTGAPCTDPDDNECTGVAQCDAAGACVEGAPPAIDDGDSCTVDYCDEGPGGAVVAHVNVCAETLDSTTTTTVVDLLGFLLDHGLQREVAAGAIDPLRAAGVSGQVVYEDGSPATDVRVEIAERPDLGWVETDASGVYRMIVQGAEVATLSIAVPGYVPVHRAVQPGWQRFATADRTVLVARQANETFVDLAVQTDIAIAAADGSSDGAGSRTGTLLIPPGTSADLELAGGGSTPTEALTLRITELTVGADGPARMPAALPAGSGYTHCFEVAVDEAEDAGAVGVSFASPVYYLLENYRGFAVGTRVFGRPVTGRQLATVTWELTYPVVYGSMGSDYARAFARAMTAPAQPGVFVDMPTVRTWQIHVGSWDARGFGLGGWSLSDVHVYDPIGRVVHYGDGSRRKARDAAAKIRAIGPAGATGSVSGFAVLPDGAIVVSNSGVKKLPLGGASYTAVGTNDSFVGTGARQLAAAPDGTLYAAGNGRVWRKRHDEST